MIEIDMFLSYFSNQELFETGIPIILQLKKVHLIKHLRALCIALWANS